MDGDGWRRCDRGHVHWGRYGAAGLLVVAPGPQVLLQHRAPWSHGGDTWGVPGGARRRGEAGGGGGGGGGAAGDGRGDRAGRDTSAGRRAARRRPRRVVLRDGARRGGR